MSILNQSPQFTPTELIQFASQQYGLQIDTHKLLPSERDQNLRLKTVDQQLFVLKVANSHEEQALIEAQNQLLQHINRSSDLCPSIISATNGNLITQITDTAGTQYFVRLVTYLEGIPLGEANRHSSSLMHDLGAQLGRLDATMVDFNHSALHHFFHWDLAQAPKVLTQYRHLITDPTLNDQLGHLLQNYTRYTQPHLHNLRQSVIHNDANDYNVIVGTTGDLYQRHQQITGFIDWGDAVYSHTINNLAIAIAYAILDKPAPLETAAQITAGYHSQYPLTSDEIEALFGLITMRLCVSVHMAAHQIAQRPDDHYLLISQEPIRRTLPKLVNTPHLWATAVLRHACGFPPTTNQPDVSNWLRENSASFHPVLKSDWSQTSTVSIDLSVSSPLVDGDFKQNSEPLFTQRIFDFMAQHDAEIGIGQYDEPRLIYANDLFSTGSDILQERRTIHLGIDLFAPTGTPIYAPLDGVVAHAQVNLGDLDYGGVIILRHETDQGKPFYTLYGHLTHESPGRWQQGQTITAGTHLADFGPPEENGNWPPHLHFQIITDLLGYQTDFPGVGRASQRALWHQLSPDPNLILNIPADQLLPKKRSKADTLKQRRQRIGRNLSIGYNKPLKMVRGWKQYLYDETGQKYLDAYNNVPHVGHSHPAIVAAITQQAPILNTNTRYLHDRIIDYANKLVETLPDPLSVCYFVNSGSEANDLALRLARAHTGHHDMIVQEGAYHGHTNTLIDISPYKHDGPGGRGAPDWVHTIPVADPYRGQFKGDTPETAAQYASQVKNVADQVAAKRGLAGFIVESCPSVGGQIIHPQGYLAAAFDHIRAAGGLCIADEVQTGYGRIGTDFYAFLAQNVIPDIVVLGKPIGNGHPIGAVVTTPEIAASFNNGMEFFSTFGGSTLSCTVGLAVLETTLAENLQQHALDVGSYLLDLLRPLQDKYPLVGDIRGSGLFLGIELVRDRATLEPADKEASYVSNRMRDHHILLGTDGPCHNVVKIRPPMPFTRANAKLLAMIIDKVLAEIS